MYRRLVLIETGVQSLLHLWQERAILLVGQIALESSGKGGLLSHVLDLHTFLQEISKLLALPGICTFVMSAFYDLTKVWMTLFGMPQFMKVWHHKLTI